MAISISFVAAGATTPALAQRSVTSYGVPDASIDEIARRLSFAVEASAFGDHAMLGESGQSVAIHPFIGFYGDDGIMSGAALSYQTVRVLPFGAGVGLGSMAADLSSWYIALSAQREVSVSDRATLLVQAVLAHQRLLDAADDPTAVYLDDTDDPLASRQDLVRLESLGASHLFVHAVYRFRLPILQPVIDLGLTGTRYGLDGYECEPDCFTPGPSRSADGAVAAATFGLGASLDIDRVAAFGGLKFKGTGAALVITLGVLF